MFTFKRLRQRVLISHSHGRLRVKITADNQRWAAAAGLVWATGFAATFLKVFMAPILHSRLSGLEWFEVLIPAAIVVVYFLALRIIIWRAFGVDDIAVEHGALHWSAKALWLEQNTEIPINEISQVKAVTSWFSGGNHVEMTVGSRRYLIGALLLTDETKELADALRRAVGER
jgi:hypothetical protein